MLLCATLLATSAAVPPTLGHPASWAWPPVPLHQMLEVLDSALVTHLCQLSWSLAVQTVGQFHLAHLGFFLSFLPLDLILIFIFKPS